MPNDSRNFYTIGGTHEISILGDPMTEDTHSRIETPFSFFKTLPLRSVLSLYLFIKTRLNFRVGLLYSNVHVGVDT